MKLALLLLLAASGSAVLTDDVYEVPAGAWRWVRFEIGHRPATVECRFEAIGTGAIRAELDSRPELDLFSHHKLHDPLVSTGATHENMFSQYVQEPGEYAIVVENLGKTPVKTHLRVSLSFGQPKQASRYLSPQRRLTVILVSFAMFFAIVTFSARALLRAMKRP